MLRRLALASICVLAFGTTPVAAQDLVRVEAARRAAEAAFPAGTYATMIEASMEGMSGPLVDAFRNMPLMQLAAMAGVPQEDLPRLDEATMGQIMAILDPHLDERMRVTFSVMGEEIASLSATFEPQVREGLAEAYANRFTTDELHAINAFFATPAGAKHAAQTYLIIVDPAVMGRMEEALPAIMAEMPRILGQVQAKLAHVPPPRDAQDLNASERAVLAELFGIAPEHLERSLPAGATE
jgi:hypothetical protein